MHGEGSGIEGSPGDLKAVNDQIGAGCLFAAQGVVALREDGGGVDGFLVFPLSGVAADCLGVHCFAAVAVDNRHFDIALVRIFSCDKLDLGAGEVHLKPGVVGALLVRVCADGVVLVTHWADVIVPLVLRIKVRGHFGAVTDRRIIAVNDIGSRLRCDEAKRLHLVGAVDLHDRKGAGFNLVKVGVECRFVAKLHAVDVFDNVALAETECIRLRILRDILEVDAVVAERSGR